VSADEEMAVDFVYRYVFWMALTAFRNCGIGWRDSFGHWKMSFVDMIPLWTGVYHTSRLIILSFYESPPFYRWFDVIISFMRAYFAQETFKVPAVCFYI